MMPRRYHVRRRALSRRFRQGQEADTFRLDMPVAELTFESGESSLSVRSFRIEEAISKGFSIAVIARSPNQIDLETIVGRSATLKLESGVVHVQNATRQWTGVCNHIEQLKAEPTGLSTYEIGIVPELWLLSQRRGHRIYQHLSIRDIVDRLLGEWRITPTWKIEQSKYPKLEYKAQYGENDHAFFSRLLEEAGIAYTLPDGGGQQTTLTLSDALETAKARAPSLRWVDNPSEAAEQEFVTEIRIAHEVRPGAYTIRDYDFRRPSFALSGEADPAPAPEAFYEQYVYDPGAFIVEGGQGGETPVADDKGVARYDERFGRERARRALGGARAARRSVAFRTNVLDLAPGVTFSIENHPHQDLSAGEQLLAVEQTIEGSIGGEWTTRGRAVFTDVPYRPPLVTLKPAVDGVQSATVVGPSGQEIHTDEFGRVRVQFPWDREGKNDDLSSCWIRVSQGWAGTGFGLLNLPRIGQEVLVGFLDGDPDQPMIVGRVFNKTNPVPYTLPDHKTRSTWKSRSSPGGDGFNELMFEDLTGRELVYVQAEKDLRKLVKNDETITVGHDRQKLVKHDEIEVVGVNRTEVTGEDRTEITGHDRTTIVRGTRRELVKGDAIERVEGERVLYVGADHHIQVVGVKRERIEKDSHTEVKGDRHEHVSGTYGLTAGAHVIACGTHAVGAGSIHLKAGALIVIEAPDVTVKGPGGFVRIDGSGVTIKGTKVFINSGGAAAVLDTGGGGNPEKPKEAKVDDPVAPTPDDVSKTGLGPGR
jgi:type VI secretion system secreted protein VgrG